MDVQSKKERNSVISLAYAEDGYSQIEIANFLSLSKSAISMIIKSDKSGDFNSFITCGILSILGRILSYNRYNIKSYLY